ncbi:hypothetical protein NMY22_g8296 [Coprinellus aureogranulatus]|nr:hypothetical protein NMY22_g8296 [Coprinellus aureogranulatus]
MPSQSIRTGLTHFEAQQARLNHCDPNHNHHDQLRNLVEALTLRVARLERKERRLLRQLANKTEDIDDAVATAESALTALTIAQGAIADLTIAVNEHNRQAAHYEHWWLAENRCLKVALDALPQAAFDLEDVFDIGSSSYARYSTYTAS